MLVAKTHDGKLVNALEDDFHLQLETFYCPSCQSPVRLKKGQIKCWHFAHIAGEQAYCHTENESEEHLFLKAKLYKTLSKDYDVEIEKYLAKTNQVIDVFVSPQLALEVQCSSISSSKLTERSLQYQEQGLYVVWLLGERLWLKKRLSPLQRRLLSYSARLGFYLWELDKEREELRLQYLIHEQLNGELVYLTKRCSLAGDIMALLRFPFQAKGIVSLKVACLPSPQTYIHKQLYYKNPKWLHQQALAYQQGKNLLTEPLESFYPQIRPPQVSVPNSQIQEKLNSYYHQFEQYYKWQGPRAFQLLYSPAFYDKMEKKMSRRVV